MRLEGIYADHLVQPLCSSRVPWNTLPRTTSRWFLNNIFRKGDPTTSLGTLCQCLVTLRGKKFLLMLNWNCLWLRLWPCSLVTGHRWVWLHPLDNFPMDTHWSDPLWTFSSPGQAGPALSAFPRMRDAPVSSSSYKPFAGCIPGAPGLSCPGQPKTGHSMLHVKPHLGEVDGEDDLPQPAGSALPCAAQDAICFLSLKGTLLVNMAATRICTFFSAGPPACTGVWCFSSPGAGPLLCLCWMSRGSTWLWVTSDFLFSDIFW